MQAGKGDLMTCLGHADQGRAHGNHAGEKKEQLGHVWEGAMCVEMGHVWEGANYWAARSTLTWPGGWFGPLLLGLNGSK